jgi:predicted amidohydrolase YtcJ
VRVDRIFVNGNLITMDPAQPRAEALAVADGNIVAVGATEETLALRQPETEVVDLKGRTVIPGLNDSHMHLQTIGAGLERVSLTTARSQGDVVQLGRRFLDEHADVQWLIGWGWNHEYFADRQMPTRYDLDQISAELPIIFSRACGHIVVVNSKALAVAGIGRCPEQPVGGVIDLDEDGYPTGILRECRGLVTRHIPRDTVEDYKRTLQAAAGLAASYGLTAVQTDDISDDMEGKLQAYSELVAGSKLPIRVNLQIRVGSMEKLQRYLELRQRFQFPPETVEYGPIKLMTDGSLGGRTAALRQPYADDPTTDGVAVLSQEQINQLLSAAHAHGLQMAGHAIGDRAMDMLLDGFQHALNQKPTADARPRIIHAQITTPDILQRIRQMGVLCDIQPGFVGTDLHMVEDRVGSERAQSTYAWRTMRTMGIPTAGGSDAPVESCNPLIGIQMAVTRQDLHGFPEGGWLPEQRLTVEEALHLYTMGSAYATFSEARRGSLTAGKLADFVVLGEDISAVNADQIHRVPVVATYVGGNVVYQA